MKHRSVLLAATVTLFSALPATPDTMFYFNELNKNGLVETVTNGEVAASAALKVLGNIVDPFNPTGPHPLAFDISGNRLIGQIPRVGDVIVSEESSSQDSDLLRFNNAGQLLIYSDAIDGADSAADVGVPTKLQFPGIGFHEVGAEGSLNGIGYIPESHVIPPNDPGYLPAATFGTVTYNFVSDFATPEPRPFVLLAIGLVGLVGWRYRLVLASAVLRLVWY